MADRMSPALAAALYSCLLYTSEIVINFAQEYPVLRDQAQTNAIPSGKIQTDTERKDVCGIVISEGTAKQLFEILKNIFSSTNAE